MPEKEVFSKIEKAIFPKLELKSRPAQKRSGNTFDHILSISAELLEEVGFEAISTNLICRRAGITPPALYRYFPNKYAVLKELGNRFMKRQNDAYLAWSEQNPLPRTATDKEYEVKRLKSLQKVINSVTREIPAAVWIMRAMHAVPALLQVRLDSHNFVTNHSFAELRLHFPNADEDELRLAVRLATEVMYTATEMVFDNPHFDEDKINSEASEMVVQYFRKFSE